MLCWALFTFLITSPWPAFHVAADRNEGSRHLEVRIIRSEQLCSEAAAMNFTRKSFRSSL